MVVIFEPAKDGHLLRGGGTKTFTVRYSQCYGIGTMASDSFGSLPKTMFVLKEACGPALIFYAFLHALKPSTTESRIISDFLL